MVADIDWNNLLVYHEQGLSNSLPYAEVGNETFDGNGNVLNHYVSGGTGTDTVTEVTGTYIITPDGFATIVYNDTNTATSSAVVNPDGSGFSWVQTNTGSTLAGEDKRISKKNN